VLQEAQLSAEADSENTLGGSSETMYFIGPDVHKRTISYGVKDATGRVHQEGKTGSTRRQVDCWMGAMPQPGIIGMQATIFSGWIYDHLLPHAETSLRGHSAGSSYSDAPLRGIANIFRCPSIPTCFQVFSHIATCS
jgi:hypothetical protein